jgi:hypothetical protein
MRLIAMLTLLAAPIASAQDAEPPTATPEAATTPTAADAPTLADPAPAPAATTDGLAPCPAQTTVLPQPHSGCLASASTRPWMRVVRIGVEAILGAGLGAVGEITGFFFGFNTDQLLGGDGSKGVVWGAALGSLMAVAPSVWLGGAIMGGDGSFGWTFLGGAAGTGVAAIILAIKQTTATTVLAAAMPVLGSIAGYELSSNGHRPSTSTTSSSSSSGVSISPSVGPNHIGVVGTF